MRISQLLLTALFLFLIQLVSCNVLEYEDYNDYDDPNIFNMPYQNVDVHEAINSSLQVIIPFIIGSIAQQSLRETANVTRSLHHLLPSRLDVSARLAMIACASNFIMVEFIYLALIFTRFQPLF